MMDLDNQICKSFSKAAKNYEKAAKIQHEIGLRLFERLDYLKITPFRILDLGCGSGYFSQLLKKRYPKATVVGIDIAFGMLQQAQKKQSWRQKWSLINGNIHCLPFADHSFDLVFSNQVLHWAFSLSNVIRELNRVMNVNGCLMFSTLGPDTFIELKNAWSKVDNYAHVNSFYDMHDIGDILMQECLEDPVVDMEFLYANYANINTLLESIRTQGVKNIHQARRKSLMGKTTFQHFKKNMETFASVENKLQLTYEVIYGHGWKGQQRKTSLGTETFIPIDLIKK